MIFSRNYIILAVSLFLSFYSHAQVKEKVETSKLSLKTYFRLPQVTSNQFYKGVSRGITDVGLSLDYEFIPNFYAGAGFKHTLIEISQFKIAENLDAKSHFFGAFGEVGYLSYLSDKVALDLGVQAGYQQMYTSCNPCREEGIDYKTNGSFFWSPNMSIFLRAGDRMGYSFSFGYTVTQHGYSPETVCLDSFRDYGPSDYQKPIQFMNFGFGFLVYLGKMDIKTVSDPSDF